MLSIEITIRLKRMPDQASSQNSSAGLEGFAARLTNVIAHTGLSQAEFARRLGVSAGFMSDAARGLKRPGAEFLHSVRTVFGVSIDWLLTGDGTMHGGSGIDLNLLRTIRLQIAVARAAIIDADPVAKVLLLLIRDGRLNEAVADPDLQAFLSRIAPADPDGDLAAELYNGHLWTKDSSEQLRNLLAAAVAHFEARKPLDKMAALVRSAGPTIQINVIPSQRIADRDYYEG